MLNNLMCFPTTTYAKELKVDIIMPQQVLKVSKVEE